MPQIRPLTGFDWQRVLWERPHEMPAPECSYCGLTIGEDDIPLMMFRYDGSACRFCNPCARRWFGLRALDAPEDGFDDGNG